MKTAEFTHLHCHSHYSIGSSMATIQRLVNRCNLLGIKALALTDIGNMSGVIEFQILCQEAGVKPILGMEALVAAGGPPRRRTRPEAGGYDLLLYAEDGEGWRNLIQIATTSGHAGPGARSPIDIAFLVVHADGLIAVAPAPSGEIHRLVMQSSPDAARQALTKYLDIFGTANFFLGVSNHDMPVEAKINATMSDFARQTGCRLVATNSIHFPEQCDVSLYDTYLRTFAQNALTGLNPPARPFDRMYMRAPAEMAEALSKWPEAIAATAEIAARCNVDPMHEGLNLPQIIDLSHPESQGITLPTGAGRRVDEVFDSLHKTYGQDRVARFVTFTRRISRAAVQDVCRALAVPPEKADQLANLIPVDQPTTVLAREAAESNPEIAKFTATDPLAHRVFDQAMRLEEVFFGCGVDQDRSMLSQAPLRELAPLYQIDNEAAIQFPATSIRPNNCRSQHPPQRA